MASTELPDLIVADGDAWQEWLGEHHETSSGVWLVLAKKNTTGPTILTYNLALDEALCYGWIDGQVGRRDESTYRQRFTPRRARSQWSARNVGIVSRLIRQGRMQPAGMNQVARAKADSRWDAANFGQASTEVPTELDTARSARQARMMFEISASQNHFGCFAGWMVPAAPRCKPGASRSLWPCSAETIHPQPPSAGD